MSRQEPFDSRYARAPIDIDIDGILPLSSSHSGNDKSEYQLARRLAYYNRARAPLSTLPLNNTNNNSRQREQQQPTNQTRSTKKNVRRRHESKGPRQIMTTPPTRGSDRDSASRNSRGLGDPNIAAVDGKKAFKRRRFSGPTCSNLAPRKRVSSYDPANMIEEEQPSRTATIYKFPSACTHVKTLVVSSDVSRSYTPQIGWRTKGELLQISKRYNGMSIQYKVMYHASLKSIKDHNPGAVCKIQKGELVVQSRFVCTSGNGGGNTLRFRHWKLPGSLLALRNARHITIYNDTRPRFFDRHVDETAYPVIVLDNALNEVDRGMVKRFLVEAKPCSTAEQFYMELGEPLLRHDKEIDRASDSDQDLDDNAGTCAIFEPTNSLEEVAETLENRKEVDKIPITHRDSYDMVPGGEEQGVDRLSTEQHKEKNMQRGVDRGKDSHYLSDYGASCTEGTKQTAITNRSNALRQKKKTYGGMKKNRQRRMQAFTVGTRENELNDYPQFFALIEGVAGYGEGNSPRCAPSSKTAQDYIREVLLHGRAESLPRNGRILELPGEAMNGPWVAELTAVEGLSEMFGVPSIAALTCDSMEHLQRVRLSLRHRKNKKIGPLQFHATKRHLGSSTAGEPTVERIGGDPSEAISVSVFNPLHSRIRSLVSQGLFTSEALAGKSNPFIGSISIVGFDGFMSSSDATFEAGKVSKAFLEGCRRDVGSKQMKFLLPIPSLKHSPPATTNIAGVMFPCKMELDDNINIYLAHDDTTGMIVAIDIIFGNPLNSNRSNSDLSTLHDSDTNIMLTKRTLQQHTERLNKRAKLDESIASSKSSSSTTSSTSLSESLKDTKRSNKSEVADLEDSGSPRKILSSQQVAHRPPWVGPPPKEPLERGASIYAIVAIPSRLAETRNSDSGAGKQTEEIEKLGQHGIAASRAIEVAHITEAERGLFPEGTGTICQFDKTLVGVDKPATGNRARKTQNATHNNAADIAKSLHIKEIGQNTALAISQTSSNFDEQSVDIRPVGIEGVQNIANIAKIARMSETKENARQSNKKTTTYGKQYSVDITKVGRKGTGVNKVVSSVTPTPGHTHKRLSLDKSIDYASSDVGDNDFLSGLETTIDNGEDIDEFKDGSTSFIRGNESSCIKGEQSFYTPRPSKPSCWPSFHDVFNGLHDEENYEELCTEHITDLDFEETSMNTFLHALRTYSVGPDEVDYHEGPELEGSKKRFRATTISLRGLFRIVVLVVMVVPLATPPHTNRLNPYRSVEDRLFLEHTRAILSPSLPVPATKDTVLHNNGEIDGTSFSLKIAVILGGGFLSRLAFEGIRTQFH